MRRISAPIALAIVALVASDARAHPLGFGVVSIRLDGTHDATVTVRVSGSEAAPGELDVSWPSGCAERGVRDVMRDEIRERVAHVHCTSLIAEQWIRVTGPTRGLEVLVETRRADGSVTRQPIESLPAEVAIAERGATSVAIASVHRGAQHFATGADHILFVIGAFLLTRKRGLRSIAIAVTAFTVGHAITLTLVALDTLVVASRPTEACVALSLLHVARELRVEGDTVTRRTPAIACGLFGLVHGAGLASAMSRAGLDGSSLALSVASFNVGLELTELALVLVLFALVRGRVIAVAERSWPLVIGGVGALLLFDRMLAP